MEYKVILQGFAIIFIIILLYYSYRYILYSFRKKRLDDYSINSKDNNIILSTINTISKKLENTKYYKKRINKYNKYLINSNFTNNNIITIKLLISIILVIIYLFECMICKITINIFILIIIFIIGYYIIDIILKIEYSNSLNKINTNISKIIIIMNNSYHINRNHKEVIEDIIEELDGYLKREFIIVKNDLDKGLDISNALYKMYERTNIDKILYISELLGLNVKYGISIIDITNRLEKDITNREKTDYYLLKLRNTNSLLFIVLSILPIFASLIIILLNYDILSLFNRTLIIIEVLLYLLYLSILSIVRRSL